MKPHPKALEALDVRQHAETWIRDMYATGSSPFAIVTGILQAVTEFYLLGFGKADTVALLQRKVMETQEHGDKIIDALRNPDT